MRSVNMESDGTPLQVALLLLTAVACVAAWLGKSVLPTSDQLTKHLAFYQRTPGSAANRWLIAANVPAAGLPLQQQGTLSSLSMVVSAGGTVLLAVQRDGNEQAHDVEAQARSHRLTSAWCPAQRAPCHC